MSTPARRTRARRPASEVPSQAGTDAGRTPATPRRSARLNSIDPVPPTAIGRSSNGYGTDGRPDLAEDVGTAANIEDAMAAMRGDDQEGPNAQLDSESRRGSEEPSERQASAGPYNRPSASAAINQQGPSGSTIRPVGVGSYNQQDAGPRLRPLGRPLGSAPLPSIEEDEIPAHQRLQFGGSAFLNPGFGGVQSAAAVGNNTTGLLNFDDETFGRAEDVSSSASSPGTPSVVSNVRNFMLQVVEAIIDAYDNSPPITDIHIRKFLLFTFATILCLFLYKTSRIPSPDSAPSKIKLSDPLTAFKHYSDVAWTSTGSWMRGTPVAGLYRYPWALDSRVKGLEIEARKTNAARKLDSQTLQKMEATFPDLIVTRVKKGVVQFPEGIFEALKERFDPLYDEKGHVPSWEAFMNVNAVQVREMVGVTADEQIENATTAKRIITRKYLVEMFEKEFSTFSDQIYTKVMAGLHEKSSMLLSEYDAKLSDHMTETDRKISDMVGDWHTYRHNERESRESLTKRLITQQLSRLAYNENMLFHYIKYAENLHIALNSVNYFSPGLGAMVDPTLTSPTKKRDRTITQALWYKFMGVRGSNRPIAALTAWEEIGDCWCAAPPKNDSNTAKGSLIPKAQIAVALPRHINVTGITVEHMPRLATTAARATPRVLELWAWIEDDKLRRAIKAETSMRWPTKQTEYPRPTKNSEGERLHDHFVLIHKFSYDIYHSNHVQFFPLHEDIARLNVVTQKVVVRAVTNWGKNFTCFYRLRLHGREPAAEPFCKNVRDPKTGRTECVAYED